MFDITAAQIALLTDTDLRTLVARLCEADLRRAGLSISAVTAGGHQNAADGGLDVRVDLPPSTNISGFIPRPATGYQVKVPDMPRQEILNEICPDGKVRPVIQALADSAGAYIIVSASGSTADAVLQRRRAAMREAVATLPNAAALTLDFYDRERLATWVNDHPGLVVWVREKVGQPIHGWRPYANWAGPAEGLEAEYIYDQATRLYDGQSQQAGPVPITEGIERIRAVLAQPRGAVRLIGLSGTGKTRLAQALFDLRLGSHPLDPALAVYTDQGAEPQPTPIHLLRWLVQNQRRLIVIVDNCLPETHRLLATICAEPSSTVSLLTIEYDVGEDEPESTAIFRLDAGSPTVIERLLERRAPHVSQLDCHRIAELSAGNARIALALARTVQTGESIARLTDKVLFDRLFYQRQTKDENLLRAAEACSLVYSFNGEQMTEETAELPILAELAAMPVTQLYRHVEELRTRELIQRRSCWRALLPQALALRLARQALERIPPAQIMDIFLHRAPGRLLKSFSRQLGHLHDSAPAQHIVQRWLAPDSELSALHQLNSLGVAIVQNIAPVAPAAALAAIERVANSAADTAFFSTANQASTTWIHLLQLLAYEATLFPRASLLLVRFAMAESSAASKNHYNSAQRSFMHLFQFHLSGTHATIAQRLQVVDTLIQSENAASQSCGLQALTTLLEAWHFSGHGLAFGAHPRDYGWYPTSADDINNWYHATLTYAQRLAVLNNSLGERVRTIVASQFRALWRNVGLADELESFVHAIVAHHFWPEGWLAVRSTLRFDDKAMPPEHKVRLITLEQILRPQGLLERVRAYVLTEGANIFELDDIAFSTEAVDSGIASERVAATIESLGRECAADLNVLHTVLPNLTRGNILYNRLFGRGLAAGADTLTTLWTTLVNALANIPANQRNLNLLYSFLEVANHREPQTTAVWLDAAVTDPTLGPCFPALQATLAFDQRSAERLEAALQLGLAPIHLYRNLAWSPAPPAISSNALQRLLSLIAAQPDGYAVAVDILKQRLHDAQDVGDPITQELRQYGRELVLRCPFEGISPNLDQNLAWLTDLCFAGADAATDAILLCQHFKTAFLAQRAYEFHYPHILTTLFHMQPQIALDEFLGDQSQNAGGFLWEHKYYRKNPLDEVSITTLIAWAQIDPQFRFLSLASTITLFTESDNYTNPAWTPVALQLLKFAPDRVAVLTEYAAHFRPTSWSGSRADVLESRRALPRTFFSDPDPQIVAWARAQDAALGQMADEARSYERHRDESFE